MADDTERLVVLLEGRIADFEKAMKRAETVGTQTHQRLTASSARMSREIQKNFSEVGASIKTFIAGYAGVEGARALLETVKKAVEAADEIGAAATRLGVGADALQRLRFAAAQADVETGQLDNALRLFSQNLAQGKIAAQGKDITEAFSNYIAKIAQAPTYLDKVSIAQAAFGKSWQAAIAIASEGADKFARNAADAFTYSDEAVEAADRLDKQFRALGDAVETGFNSALLEQFGGGLRADHQQLVTLNEAAAEFGRITGQVFVQAQNAAVSLAGAIKSISDEWDKLPAPLKTGGQIVGRILNPIGTAAEGAQSVGDQLGGPKPLPSLDFNDQTMPGAAGAKGTVAPLGDYADAADRAAMASESFWKATTQHDADWVRQQSQIKSLAEETKKFGDTIADAFADGIVNGEKFSDIVADLSKQLEKMLLSYAFQTIIGAALGTPAVGGNAGGGILGSLFHEGGIVGEGRQRTRSVPLSAFTFAPRFHGGFMPDEFPAILKRGEGVFTPEQMKRMGGKGRSDGGDGNGGVQQVALKVDIYVDDKGQLMATAREAGRQGAVRAAQVEVHNYHQSNALKQQILGTIRNPRMSGSR